MANEEKNQHNHVKFKEGFENSYTEVEKHIKNVSLGNAPDIDELCAIIEGIFAPVNIKGAAFAYLNHLVMKDDYVHEHSVSVATVCRIFADWLRLDSAETNLLVACAILHDVGMESVPSEIVNKKDRLTPQEFEEIKRHTIHGYNLLKNHDIPEDIMLAALQHHERIDGSGYPAGLVGDRISKYAKIIGIADNFTAMICERPYRKKKDAFDVIRTFEREFMSILDTEYLLIFLENIAYYYVNRRVKLSNGKEGTVVFINKAQYSSPIISLDDGTYVDLLFDKSITISETL